MYHKILKTMLALCCVFLVALYVLKIFFPEQFVISIEIDAFITIGNYVDTHAWLEYPFGILTAFITYWLYLCAVCRKWYLNLSQSLIVLFIIGLSIGFTFIDINLYSALSYTSFIFLPLLFKANLKEVGIVYTVHIFSQFLTASIRDIMAYVNASNTLIVTLLSIECYFWLLLFYFYYNYKKEKSLWVGNVRQCTENTLDESKRKSQNLTEKLSLCKKIKRFIKNNLNKTIIKHRLRKLKLNLKDFIIDELWIYVIILGSIALCAWIFNRWIEGIMLCIAHIYIRKVFDKQYHCNTTAACLSLTLGLIWFAIPITLPLSTSLLSSIPIAFIICFFGFLAQDRLDAHLEIKRLNKYVLELLEKLETKDIYAMSKDELYEHCRSKGLDDVECKIAYYVVIERLKGQELYDAIGYSERQTIRKRKEILSKIK